MKNKKILISLIGVFVVIASVFVSAIEFKEPTIKEIYSEKMSEHFQSQLIEVEEQYDGERILLVFEAQENANTFILKTETKILFEELKGEDSFEDLVICWDKELPTVDGKMEVQTALLAEIDVTTLNNTDWENVDAITIDEIAFILTNPFLP